MIQVFTLRERYGPLTSILLQWNLILVKSGSLSLRKNSEISDVSIFFLNCNFITEAPNGSREKKYFFEPNRKFPDAL